MTSIVGYLPKLNDVRDNQLFSILYSEIVTHKFIVDCWMLFNLFEFVGLVTISFNSSSKIF